MAQGIDVSELDKFTSTLLEIAEKKMPKELPYFMNRESLRAVSYTHLDVYKRQGLKMIRPIPITGMTGRQNS